MKQPEQQNNSIQANFADASTLIEITEKIIARHQEIGPESPLNPGQIADLNYKINHAKAKHAEGLKYKRLMENAWAERDLFLRTEKGSSGFVNATVQDLCTLLKDIFKEDREELDKWGL